LTTKNAGFWAIETQFIPHRKHITSLLQSSTCHCYVRFEVFTTVTMKDSVFWDVTPPDSCKNRSFEGTYRLHHQSDKNWRAGNNDSRNVPPKRRFLQEPRGLTSQKTALFLNHVRFEVLTAVTRDLTRATRRNIPEDTILLES
jgi:hypothetical protein